MRIHSACRTAAFTSCRPKSAIPLVRPISADQAVAANVRKGSILLKNSISRVYRDSEDRRQSRRKISWGSAKQSVLPRVTLPHGLS
jgi:hypothetical protein